MRSLSLTRDASKKKRDVTKLGKLYPNYGYEKIFLIFVASAAREIRAETKHEKSDEANQIILLEHLMIAVKSFDFKKLIFSFFAGIYCWAEMRVPFEDFIVFMFFFFNKIGKESFEQKKVLSFES